MRCAVSNNDYPNPEPAPNGLDAGCKSFEMVAVVTNMEVMPEKIKQLKQTPRRPV